MKRNILVLGISAWLLFGLAFGCMDAVRTEVEQQPLRALIIDGQNNHPIWPKTTMMLKDYLEQTGLFEVDISRTAYVWQGPHNSGFQDRESRDSLLAAYPLDGFEYISLDTSRPDPGFAPEFHNYDVVVSNFGWMAAPWPEATRDSLESYVASGGGFVVLHAGSNPFANWYEYNRMTGVGGWGGRDSAAGPYIYYDESGMLQRDVNHGACGAHGTQHDFLITIRDTTHPITRGMPPQWLHPKDELYERMCGPGIDLNVLATAYSDPEGNAAPWSPGQPASGNHEPQIMTIRYGNGRVFHTTLGHADYSMECVGFITAFQRGVEWAATGNVSQKLPDDFPTSTAASTRPWMQ